MSFKLTGILRGQVSFTAGEAIVQEFRVRILQIGEKLKRKPVRT